MLAARDLVAVLVEHDVGEAQHVARRVALGAAQDGADARDHLGEAERLRHVVVAAGASASTLFSTPSFAVRKRIAVLKPCARRRAPDLDAVEVGQHHVEDDQVGLGLRDRGERAAAGGGLVDVEALVAQRGRDGVDDRRLVVDDQDPAPPLAHLRRNDATGSWELPVKRRGVPCSDRYAAASEPACARCAAMKSRYQ